MNKTYNLRLSRREYKRFIINGSANFIINYHLHKPLIIKDLSSRGVQVFSDYPFKIGERIHLVMVIPFFDKPIHRKAKIVWSKEVDKHFWEAGLDFGVNNLLSFT